MEQKGIQEAILATVLNVCIMLFISIRNTSFTRISNVIFFVLTKLLWLNYNSKLIFAALILAQVGKKSFWLTLSTFPIDISVFSYKVC